jgi:hypothetical protein
MHRHDSNQSLKLLSLIRNTSDLVPNRSFISQEKVGFHFFFFLLQILAVAEFQTPNLSYKMQNKTYPKIKALKNMMDIWSLLCHLHIKKPTGPFAKKKKKKKNLRIKNISWAFESSCMIFVQLISLTIIKVDSKFQIIV